MRSPIRFQTPPTPAPNRPKPAAPRTAPPKPAAQKPAPPVFRQPRPLWKTFVRRGESSPATDGRESFLCAATQAQRLDAGGRVVWAVEIGLSLGEAALDTKRMYVGTEAGAVIALDRASGASAWRTAVSTDPIRSAPAVGAGKIFIDAADNAIYALDVASGTLRWRFVRPDGALGYGAPAIDASGLFVSGDSTLYRLDPNNGKEIWRASVGGKALSAPAIGGGLVIVGGDDAALTAYSTASGEKAWRFAGLSDGDWFGAPLVAGDRVFVATWDRFVYCLDRATGEQVWSARLLGGSLSRPALDARRNTLYVTSVTFRDNPTVSAIDTSSGVRVWETRLGRVDAAPVISSNALFVCAGNGYYHAFSLE